MRLSLSLCLSIILVTQTVKAQNGILGWKLSNIEFQFSGAYIETSSAHRHSPWSAYKYLSADQDVTNSLDANQVATNPFSIYAQKGYNLNHCQSFFGCNEVEVWSQNLNLWFSNPLSRFHKTELGLSIGLHHNSFGEDLDINVLTFYGEDYEPFLYNAQIAFTLQDPNITDSIWAVNLRRDSVLITLPRTRVVRIIEPDFSFSVGPMLRQYFMKPERRFRMYFEMGLGLQWFKSKQVRVNTRFVDFEELNGAEYGELDSLHFYNSWDADSSMRYYFDHINAPDELEVEWSFNAPRMWGFRTLFGAGFQFQLAKKVPFCLGASYQIIYQRIHRKTEVIHGGYVSNFCLNISFKLNGEGGD